MKRKIIGLGIALLGVFLVTSCAQAGDWRKLEEKLNPERKRMWILIGDKEASQFFRNSMKKYRLSTQGYGFYFIDAAEGFTQSSYPLITAFSPDQTVRKERISLQKTDPKYHYLFVIPISELEKILAEDKCVIVSQKVKTSTVRQTLDDKGEWTIVSETERETYVTLIAAPNKRSLKKAVTRFFTVEEVPLDPIVFTAK